MYRSAYNIIFHLYIIENNVMPFNLRYFDESFLAVDLYTFYCMRKKEEEKNYYIGQSNKNMDNFLVQ